MLATLVKDLFSMHILHRLSHQKKSLYKYHKQHHTYAHNISTWGVYTFDILDLFLENGVGFFTILGLHWWMFGEPLPMHTLLFQIWFDATVHSVNPYASSFLNPLLDAIWNPVVAHNLHHTLFKSHYGLLPFHQLLRGGIRSDYKRYDDLFKTALSGEDPSLKLSDDPIVGSSPSPNHSHSASPHSLG